VGSQRECSEMKDNQGGKNLEYLVISLNMEKPENSVQHQRKTVTNKMFFVRRSNVCVKLLFWTSKEQSHALLI